MKSRILKKGFKRRSLRNKNKKSRRVRKSKVLYGGEKYKFLHGNYEGELFRKDKNSRELGPKIYPHGQGTMTYENGDVYTGNFTEGVHEGQGKMTYADGCIYEGNFRRNRPHGQGTMTYKNGDVYEGTWYDGQKKGQVEMTYANGSKSIGYYNSEGKQDAFRVMSGPK